MHNGNLNIPNNVLIFLKKIFNCFIELDFMNRTTKRRILKKVSTWLVKRTKVCAMKTNMPTLNMVHV